MPIFDVEMLSDAAPPPGLAKTLADELGTRLDAAPGHVWVTTRSCSPEHYAENSAEPVPRWVFVRVILRDLPDEAPLAALAEDIAGIVARHTVRERDDVHVLFEPAARGRIAFGGALVRSGT